MALRMKITRGGQISIPASIRRRWQTSTVTLADEGDRVVVRPALDDPVEAASGALAAELSGVSLEELRARAREDERTAVRRRLSD